MQENMLPDLYLFSYLHFNLIILWMTDHRIDLEKLLNYFEYEMNYTLAPSNNEVLVFNTLLLLTSAIRATIAF